MTLESRRHAQENPSCIRNICILAHIDHGKTTIADSLLASNGIISQKLAGKVRYLDSRPDEQERGITMESSAISLFYRIYDDNDEMGEYVINLIDAPGHVDFSSEVSAASRLCDGALIVVDVVEGVCSQTLAVLRQAWSEKLKAILVFNKMDRLITELQLTPLEAHHHLLRLLEQVNAAVGSIFSAERLRKADEAHDLNVDELNISDDDIYFAPELGNVIFSSAVDGWSFRVGQFAKIYAAKLGVKEAVLTKILWGDYYLEPKTKKVLNSKSLKGRNLKPLFVDFILANIWAIYRNTIMERDQSKIDKIIQALDIKLNARDLKDKQSRNLLQSIFYQWLPLSKGILLATVDIIPSPNLAQKTRMGDLVKASPGGTAVSLDVLDALAVCDTAEDSLMMAYISKVIAVPANESSRVSQPKAKDDFDAPISEAGKDTHQVEHSNGLNGADLENDADDSDTNTENLIGFARLFSGTIKIGQTIYIFGPRYNPSTPDKYVTSMTVESLFLLMGRDVRPVESISAGNVFGLGNIEGKILRNATIGSTKHGVNFAGLKMVSDAVVRVAVEPKDPSEIPKLLYGLKLLNQADSCVEILQQETGENVLETAGELHLERCLTDLRERFAKIELEVSKPMISFRETIVNPPEIALAAKEREGFGLKTVSNSDGSITLSLRVQPLDNHATICLLENEEMIKKALKNAKHRKHDVDEDSMHTEDVAIQTSKDSYHKLVSKLQSSAKWNDPINEDQILAFGPRSSGPNLLINRSKHQFKPFCVIDSESEIESTKNKYNEYEDSILTAFHLATFQGPLCSEPVQGVLCSIEDVQIKMNDEEDGSSSSGQVYGQMISLFRQAFKQAFLDWSPRLMLAMYECEIQANAEVLGKVYNVISKSRGKILSEEMKEGTSIFSIIAAMPVVESFGFAEDIRKKTSGGASPQLIFKGFEILDIDPFWIPSTEEELEDIGEFAERENLAKKYMNDVRRRKGLFIETKKIRNAEKQKTLKR